MISRNGQGGFFAEHYDWIVLAVGVLALSAGIVFFVCALGEDPEEAAADAVRTIDSRKPASTGVKPVEMDELVRAYRAVKNPAAIAALDDKLANFLASERRVFCAACHEPIPAGLETCPLCSAKQESEVKPVFDTDEDGLPDEWEKKYALNPNDAADAGADADNDGFTNAEEFEAGTDPTDPKSHPDYLDSLRVQLPLKETVLPFYFEKISPLPGGKVRLFFKDPSKKNDYGQKGVVYSAVEDEEIGKTGFIVKGYEHRTEKRTIKGSGEKGGKALEREVDVSVAKLERKSDGKKLELAINEKRKPVDVQATLVYERGAVKEFVVVAGDSIDLNGTVYRIISVKTLPKGAAVMVEHALLGKIKTLEALEQ